VDNQTWFEGLSWLTVLRDVGKHFSLSAMLGRDSVKNRLDSESGISFTEFAYQVMQGFDFLHLFDAFGCTLQLGGSDQWGNIVAGIDLVRKTRRASVAGLTLPLVTTAAGEKFGKSAGNAIWLDARRTSPWQLFQYLVRQDDSDVGKLLRLFTFLPEDEIAALELSAVTDVAARRAQRKLAVEVVALVHGQAVAREMERAAAVMFGGEITGISEETLGAVLAGVPTTDVSALRLDQGIALSELLRSSGLATSLTRAREFIGNGAAYINNVRTQSDVRVGREHLATTQHIVLRRGKKDYHVLRITNSKD
jgi:tyrosyl-tRNA synthetase